MKLTHVRLLVDDFDTCFRFYRDVMGFQVAWGAEGSAYADFRNRGEAMVALFSRQDMADSLGLGHMPSNTQCQYKAMLIFEAADLDSMVDALKARGAQFITELQDRPDWGIRAAHLRDPEGNLIELNSPLLEAQWSSEEEEGYAETGQAGESGTLIGDTDLVQ